jgi:hypothetical protein
MIQLIAEFFPEIFQRKALAPESWKTSLVKVLFKKGNPKQPGNYRPITLLPILYKLFSRILCGRIRKTLEDAQPVDQAGFRAGYSCDDHLFTVMLLVERMGEFQLPLWMCAVDFQKAFDTVEHGALWQALREQGVDPCYVRILKTLYKDQSGRVCGKVKSKPFKICRGTKQGDPLSPMLFNAVLESVIKPIHEKWRLNNFGVKIGRGRDDRLCNLRFADDLLLIASTERQLKIMIKDLVESAARVGLEIHPEKTKILANEYIKERRGRFMSIGSTHIEVLPADGATKYLGRLLSLSSIHDMELDHRIGLGWKRFFANKAELCGKHIRWSTRLKLFNAIVTPTVLYGSGSWTMTSAREKALRTTQRRMLRWMFGARYWQTPARTDDESSDSEDYPEPENTDAEEDDMKESWVEWMKRTTGALEEQLKKADIDEWVAAQRRRKWRWAGHTARRDDGRWSTMILDWLPENGCRKVGHPARRWTDDLNLIVGGEMWLFMAHDRDEWKALEADFVQKLQGG